MPMPDPGPWPSLERAVLRVLLYLTLFCSFSAACSNAFRPEGSAGAAGFACVVLAVCLAGLAASAGRRWD